MRLAILILLSFLPAIAADINFSTSVVLVDDPATPGVDEAAEIVATINAWKATQFLDDGVTPKYANNAALAKAILEDGVQRIIQAACNQGLTCPTPVQAQYNAAATADAAKKTVIDQLVSIE